MGTRAIWGGLCAIVLVVTGNVLAEVVRAPRAEGEQVAIPSAAVAAVEAAWKCRDLGKRMQQPGAAGQQDAFWELIQLCEGKAEARADKNVEALFDWLLFDASLIQSPILTDPATTKMSELIPSLGRKILLTRVTGLFNNAGNDYITGPWDWAGFNSIDKKALGAAYVEYGQKNPQHNPVTRFYYAAGLWVCEHPDGEKEMSAARAALQKDLPLQVRSLEARLSEALLRGGIKQVLPLLLEQAEAELKNQPNNGGEGRFARETYSNALAQFEQAMGWQTPASRRTASAARVEELKGWVKEHLAEVKWDAARHQFACDVAPPGMEKAHAASKKVEAALGFNVFERMNGRNDRGPVRELLNAAQAKPSKDPDVQDAVAELVNMLFQRSGEFYANEEELSVFMPLGKTQPELAVKIWTRLLSSALFSPNAQNAGRLLRAAAMGEEIGAKVFAQIEADAARQYEEARKNNDVQGALTKAMVRLYAGGGLNAAQLAELLEKAPEWNERDRNGNGNKLAQWTQTMLSAGRTGALRLLLFRAGTEKVRNTYTNYTESMGSFYSLCQWSEGNELPKQKMEEQLAVAQGWLDANEKKLSYDAEKSRFVGAPPPHKAVLYALIEKAPAKLGLSAADVLSYEGPTRALNTLLNPGDPKMMEDPAWQELLLGLLKNSGKQEGMMRSTALRAISQMPAAFAPKLLADQMEYDVGTIISQRGHPSELIYERRHNIDRKVAAAARELAAAGFKKRFDAWQEGKQGKPASKEPLILAMVCAWGGVPIKFEELSDLFKNGWYQDNINDWADAMLTTQNPAGLRLLLINAQTDPPRSANTLARLETAIGMRARGGMFRGIVKAPPERLAILEKWLNENEAKLVWDEKLHYFAAPGVNPPNMGEEGAGAPPQGIPVKPPKPPAEQF